MDDSIFVNVLDSGEDLLHKVDNLGFFEFLFFYDKIEEFASFGILHNEMNVRFALYYLHYLVVTSYNCMIFGCLSIFKMHIYRVTRSISACSIIFSFCRVLTATFCSVRMCVPSLTLPKVPYPMHFPN
jgi:hypothetical protein